MEEGAPASRRKHSTNSIDYASEPRVCLKHTLSRDHAVGLGSAVVSTAVFGLWPKTSAPYEDPPNGPSSTEGAAGWWDASQGDRDGRATQFQLHGSELKSLNNQIVRSPHDFVRPGGMDFHFRAGDLMEKIGCAPSVH
jgi:hypothetical protein